MKKHFWAIGIFAVCFSLIMTVLEMSTVPKSQHLCDIINTNKQLSHERFCKSVESVTYDNLHGWRIVVLGMDDNPHIYYLNRS